FSEAAVFAMAGVFVVNLLVFLVLPGNRQAVVEAVGGEDDPETVGEKVGREVYSAGDGAGSSSKRRDRSGQKKRLPLGDTWHILKRHMKNMPGIMLQGLGVGMLLPVLPPVLRTYIPSELSLNYFQYTSFILIVFGLVAFSMTALSRGLDTYSMRLTFAVICGGFFIYAAGIIWFSTLETIWLIFAIAS